MGKKYNNILPSSEIYHLKTQKYQFICRGCFMPGRKNKWYGYLSSINSKTNQIMDNSYLVLEEEPENKFDHNAIKIIVHGEFYGLIGYVGREYTHTIKEILRECEKYRIDAVEKQECEKGKGTVDLVLSWIV